MKCPKCGGKTTVTETKHQSTDEVLRSRVCKSCQHKFYTIEYEAQADAKFVRYWRDAKHGDKAYKKGE